MNYAHKIIKYIALAFALSIIFSIISFGVTVIDTVTNGINNNHKVSSEILKLEKDKTKKVLDIKVRTAKVEIKEGTELEAKSTSKYITIEKKGNTLIIREKKHSLKNKCKVIITIPKDYNFDAASIISGTGSFKIDKVSTDILDISSGIGSISFNNLVANKKATIEAGIGSLKIKNGVLTSTKLDLGIGSVNITAKLLNKTSIEAGIGNVTLNLIGSKGDYSITTDKGIGSITLDGKSVSDEETYGAGSNIIDIEGGIGDIKIKHLKN